MSKKETALMYSLLGIAFIALIDTILDALKTL